MCLREQSRIAQRRLYPLTVFYTTYALIVALLGLRSAHPWIGIISYLAGIPVWSLVEYLFHRYVLHGRFPPGKASFADFFTLGSTLFTGNSAQYPRPVRNSLDER